MCKNNRSVNGNRHALVENEKKRIKNILKLVFVAPWGIDRYCVRNQFFHTHSVILIHTNFRYKPMTMGEKQNIL